MSKESDYNGKEGVASVESVSRTPSPQRLVRMPRDSNSRLLHPAAVELPSEGARMFVPRARYRRMSSDDDTEDNDDGEHAHQQRHHNNNNNNGKKQVENNENNNNNSNNNNNNNAQRYQTNAKPSFMICDILGDSHVTGSLPAPLQLIRSANSAFTSAKHGGRRTDFRSYDDVEDHRKRNLSPLNGAEKRKYEEIFSDDGDGRCYDACTARGISASRFPILFQVRFRYGVCVARYYFWSRVPTLVGLLTGNNRNGIRIKINKFYILFFAMSSLKRHLK